MDMNFIFEQSTQYLTSECSFQRRNLLCDHNDGDLFTCEDMKFSLESSLYNKVSYDSFQPRENRPNIMFGLGYIVLTIQNSD